MQNFTRAKRAKLFYRLLFCLLPLFLFSCDQFFSVDDATPNPVEAQIEYLSEHQNSRYLSERLEDAIPSFVAGAVLISQGDEILVNRGFGAAYRASGRPVTTATVFDILSISKVYTAVAVLRLQDQGWLSIDDPIGKYLDGLPDPVSRLTIRQCLNHSSGLPAHFSGGDFTHKTSEEALEELRSIELEFEPGSDWLYSDMANSVVGLIIEKVTGKPFTQALKELVIEPAGLQSTGFYGDPKWIETGAAHGVTGTRISGSPASWDESTWSLLGAGGMVSSPKDMFYFWRSLIEQRLIKPETLQEQFLKTDISFGKTFEWDQINHSKAGLGILSFTDNRGRRYFYKGGSGDFGFMGIMFWRESDDVFIASMFNEGVVPGYSEIEAVAENTIEHSTLYRRILAIMDEVSSSNK